MGGRGRLSGIGCHIEYHTVDPKKPKAANCIYLDEQRICNCKKSPWYTSKCFVASSCTFRVKAKEEPKKKEPQQPKRKIQPQTQSQTINLHNSSAITACPYPVGTKVYHSVYGEGTIVKKRPSSSVISIQFSKEKKDFLFPNCFENEKMMKLVNEVPLPRSENKKHKSREGVQSTQYPTQSKRRKKHHFQYLAPYELQDANKRSKG